MTKIKILLLATIPDTPAWQLALFACNLLAFIALFVRILSMRVAKAYPALLVWLGFNIIFDVWPWVVPMDIRAYYRFYICVEGSALFLYLFVVLELYAKVLKELPGLATTMKIFIQVAVPASAIVAASLLALEKHPVIPIDWLYRVDRTVITSLVLCVLMITAFMVWFPIRVARNIVTYSVGYAAYLLPKGATLFLMNQGWGNTKLTGAICMAASTLCLLFWTLALDRAGEVSMVSLGSLFHPQDEARLVTQLEAINRTLLRTSQR